MRNILFFAALTLLCACGGRTSSTTDISADSLYNLNDSVLSDTAGVSDTISIKYAKGLTVSYKTDGIHVTIKNPVAEGRHARVDSFVVKQPSRRFICTTALQLGNFETLRLEDCIVGMNSLRNIFSPRMKARLASGQTAKIGKEGNFDIETVIALEPDYIFVSASKHGGYDALLDCGIPLIQHHGYKETHPLGQAEWIKLIGLLAGETKRANAVFNNIEAKYLKLCDEVKSLSSTSTPSDSKASPKGGGLEGASKGASERTSKKGSPTILSGRQLRDGWYLMGGKSYMAQLFKDAGADYIFADIDESGGTTIDFEAAYARGINADFWQMDGAFDNGDFTLQNLSDEDARYADIKAYKEGKVLFCNLSQTPYRELSPVEPHLVLADLVKAFHPEILPNYVPKYYKLIK